MSCRFCVHWVGAFTKAETTYRKGECRRYPRPEETAHNYRCGEFLCEPDRGWDSGQTLMESFFVEMQNATGAYHREKTERIRLQKEAKRLRAAAREKK